MTVRLVSRQPSILIVAAAGAGTLAAAVSLWDPRSVMTAIMGMLLVIFTAFSVRHLAFSLVATRHAPRDRQADDPTFTYQPMVSVLVACHEEALVIEGLVRSLKELDYRPGALQIILVNDGSTDETGALADRLTADDPRIEVIHRAAGSPGGKSGALNEALSRARGEVTVIFDADHEPHSDVVLRLVRHFVDPTVAAVQGACHIKNPEASLISRLVSLDYQAGYLVNEYGRQTVFGLPAYGGANCAVRTELLHDIGGWNENSVTEDTDLTLRLILLGNKVRYDVTAIDEEQAVTSLRRFWTQRYRWARGHQQVWRDYRGAVWSSKVLGFGQKLETTMFLLAFHVPVLAAAGLVLFPFMFAGAPLPSDPIGGFVLWTLLFVGPLIEIGAGMLIGGSPRRRVFDIVFFIPLFIVAMALCTKALWDTAIGRPYGWVKTPRGETSVEATA